MRYLALAVLMPLAACSFQGDDGNGAVKGSGTQTSRTYAIADFTGVDLRGSDDVDVRVGTGFSVRAEGNAAALDHLHITLDGTMLHIGQRKQSGFEWSKSRSAKVFVTLPRIAEANVAGSGTLTIDRVEQPTFEAAIAGSGGLNVAALEVGSADLNIAGSGDMKLSGASKRIEMSIAGSGDIDAAGVKAQSAKVSITGSGSATAAVTGPAEISVIGSGDVDLGPNAKCSTTKMGSGSVTCGN